MILEQDPVVRGAENPAGMRDTPVLETWDDGREVYAVSQNPVSDSD